MFFAQDDTHLHSGRFPIIVKFNVCDGFEGGTTVQEQVQCAQVCILATLNFSSAFLTVNCHCSPFKFDFFFAQEEAGLTPQWYAEAGADALVPSGGFTSRNGFWMLRGDVPLWSMFRAMPGRLKAFATLLFGKFFVPTVHYEEGFFRASARCVGACRCVSSQPTARYFQR